MSTDLTIVDTDTRLGALKRETHWSVVLASTGGGLTFTWVAHMMDWTPLLFAVHGATGIVGGYLVGTGLARVITGTRVRLPAVRYEEVSTVNRFVSSGLRIAVGALFFGISYLVATGVSVSTETLVFAPHLLGMLLPVGIWGFILFAALGRKVLRLMR